jgi:hypothetical protein
VNQIRMKHDPIQIHGNRLNPIEKSAIESEIDDEINIAFEKASKDPFPPKFD